MQLFVAQYPHLAKFDVSGLLPLSSAAHSLQVAALPLRHLQNTSFVSPQRNLVCDSNEPSHRQGVLSRRHFPPFCVPLSPVAFVSVSRARFLCFCRSYYMAGVRCRAFSRSPIFWHVENNLRLWVTLPVG